MTFHWSGIGTRDVAPVPSVTCNGCGKVNAPKHMTDWARFRLAPRGWLTVRREGARKDYCPKCKWLGEDE
jgi:hypothetical protein